MANDKLPPQEVLVQLLNYDRETGELNWLHRPIEMFTDGVHSAAHTCAKWNSRMANKPALDCLNDKGYKHGAIFGKSVLAHRVAFKIETGLEPDEVDHQDGNRTNNRFLNFRPSTRLENGKNCAISVRNTSGHIGVRKSRQNWQAFITVNHEMLCLGTFPDFEKAVAVRKEAELHYNFHKNHGRKAMKLLVS